jgi:membrane associated rhomboid family serine protease
MVPLSVHADHGYSRLLTSAFLHFSIVHIGLDMWSLFIVGPLVEQGLGRVRFAALYLACALGGSVFSYLVSPDNIQSAGASGAICGLMGAFFVLARRSRLDTSTIVTLIVINLIFGFAVANIDWRDHIGGLITGGLVSLGFLEADRHPGRHALAINVGSVAAAVVILAILVQLPPGHVNLS